VSKHGAGGLEVASSCFLAVISAPDAPSTNEQQLILLLFTERSSSCNNNNHNYHNNSNY
jgi:hypothetical protein